MPRYPFCCEVCGLAFEVSRSMSEAGGDAVCPEDGGRATRVFEAPQMSFGRPALPRRRPAPGAKGFSHHGHRHAAGTGHHTHGPAASPGAGA